MAVTGMPGAGKSTFTTVASQCLGIPTWYVGQPLLDECNRRGLPPTYANRMDMGRCLGLFDDSAPLKFIERSYAAMRAQHPEPLPVIFDAVRSLGELEFLKRQEESVVLVAVLLSRAERHRRLIRRDNSSPIAVQQRDQIESGTRVAGSRQLGVGQLIALADYYILPPDGDAADYEPLRTGELPALLSMRN
jgi:dephospho-CoA kinase